MGGGGAYRQQAFGRESSTTAFVRVGSGVQPVLGEFEPVSFRGLTVEVRVNKAGGLTESWRAEELDDKAEHRHGLRRLPPSGSSGKAA